MAEWIISWCSLFSNLRWSWRPPAPSLGSSLQRACASRPSMKQSLKRTWIELWGSFPVQFYLLNRLPCASRWEGSFSDAPFILLFLSQVFPSQRGGSLHREEPALRREWVQGCRFPVGTGAPQSHTCVDATLVSESHWHRCHATPSYLTTELAWHQDDGLLPYGSLHTPCVIPTSSPQRQRLGPVLPCVGWISLSFCWASRREVRLYWGHPNASVPPPLASLRG